MIPNVMLKDITVMIDIYVSSFAFSFSITLWQNNTNVRMNQEVNILEIKINKEIREYTESVFFGLSLRQFIFSILACGVAIGLYFLLNPYLGTETVSWVCVLGAAPFASFGFVNYNGMTLEKLIWAWFKSEFLIPKKLVFHPENLYYESVKPYIEKRQKEETKKHD